MSNHFDGLTAANNAKLDILDTYVFEGRTGTVLVMNTNTPLSPSYTGPGWDTEAVYDHKIDINEDGKPELAFRARFSGHTHADGSPSAQRWSLSLHLSGADNPESVGLPLLSNAACDQVHNTFIGVRAFAGVVGEPFFVPFPLVSAVRTSLLEGTALDLSEHDPETAVNAFAGTNVNSIVIEIPNLLGLMDGLTIHHWASVTGPLDSGCGWRQVDRCAIPMISTIFGFNEGDDYNESLPRADDESFGPRIEELVRAAVEANASHPDPVEWARLIRARLMPDTTRYKIGTSAQLGNGRALAEDAAEAVFNFVLNANLDTGLSIEDASGELRDEFPYLAEPVESEIV